MKIKPLPPVEFLNECFDYIPETGKLFWKKERPLHHFKNAHGMRIHNSRWGGTECGTLVKGRRVVRLFYSEHFLIHRIIFVICGKDDPGEWQIDHRDGNPLNNRLDNLRLATNQMNNANIGRKSYLGRTRKLPKGVYPNGNHFQAKIKVNYKVFCLGTYKTPEEASVAYGEAAKHHFGEFHRV